MTIDSVTAAVSYSRAQIVDTSDSANPDVPGDTDGFDVDAIMADDP